MKIAVMGAGGVGSFFGALLARAGRDVHLVTRSAHVEAIQRNGGLMLESVAYTGPVALGAGTTPDGVAGADLVLFCVKSGDTERAGESMRPYLGEHTPVLSLQNGADNAERLSAVLGRHVIPAIVYVAVGMAGPGHVRHHGRGELRLGEAPQSEAIARQLTASGVPTDVAPDVMAALWDKLIINCAFNAMSAIPQMPYGELMASPGVPKLMHDIVEEGRAVAAAAGIALTGDLHEGVRRIAATMATQRSSTGQDLAAGKATEIDHLNGYVVRRGESLGVPTPVNRALWVLVKLMERRSAPRG